MLATAAFVIGAVISRIIERFVDTEKSSDTSEEGPQSDLLLAVSSADPVAIPDVPGSVLEPKLGFAIAIDRPGSDRSPAYSPANVDQGIQSRSPMHDPQRLFGSEDLAKEHYETGGRSDSGVRSSPAGSPVVNTPSTDSPPAGSRDASTVVSTTRLGRDTAANESERVADSTRDEAGELDFEENRADRFVSITRLNEQMGPPAPEEDDDEAGWLWFADESDAWLASVVAGLLGGGGVIEGGGSAIGATSGAEVTTSALNITLAAGPFLEGELEIRAVDSAGNLLFRYEGESPGSVIGDGVTLQAVETDRVLDERVITGLDVEFVDFSGPVFLQVDDRSAYIDEALEKRVELDIPLRGVGEVPVGGMGEVSLTPFTELAIQLIESEQKASDSPSISVSLDADNADGLAAAQSLIDAAADRVRDLTGVDIRDTRPIAVNQASFEDSTDRDSNQYGLKLAALAEFAGETAGDNRVQTAIDKLTEDVIPVVDDEKKTIEFKNPGKFLENQVELTDSLEEFVGKNADIRELVIDADRPITPPTIDEFIVVNGSPVIKGEAQLFDTNNAEGTDDLSLRIAINDANVFSVDGVEGPAKGQLTIVESGSAGEPGRWELTLSDLDPGVYSLNVFVVDTAANATKAEGADVGRSPQLQFLTQTLANPNAPTAESIEVIEGEPGSTELVVSDLDAGDQVSTRSIKVSADPGNNLVLTDDQIAGLVDFPGDGGEVLADDARFSIRDLAISGAASILDPLAAGETAGLTYTITVEDTEGNASNEAVLDVVITGANDAPSVDQPDSVLSGSVIESSAADTTPSQATPATGQVIFTDVDSADSLTATTDTDPESVAMAFSAAGDTQTSPLPGGLDAAALRGGFSITDSATGTWRYDASGLVLEALASGDTVTLTYTVTGTDSQNASTSESVFITLIGTNDAPVVSTSLADRTFDDGEAVSLDISSSFADPDAGDTLVFSATGLPEGVSIDSAVIALHGESDGLGWHCIGERWVRAIGRQPCADGDGQCGLDCRGQWRDPLG
jgi:VCBS repeat-containing protein